MASIEIDYKLKLAEKEKDALKKFLGKFSHIQKTNDYGLTMQESEIISEIYDQLPFSDED